MMMARESDAARLPVGGEVSDDLWQRLVEGQPMVLTRHGRPVAVVVDVDSWGEIEALTAGEPR